MSNRTDAGLAGQRGCPSSAHFMHQERFTPVQTQGLEGDVGHQRQGGRELRPDGLAPDCDALTYGVEPEAALRMMKRDDGLEVVAAPRDAISRENALEVGCGHQVPFPNTHERLPTGPTTVLVPRVDPENLTRASAARVSFCAHSSV